MSIKKIVIKYPLSVKSYTVCFQLENKNQELQQENESLQDQVEILRERLLALPAFAAKEIYRRSQQVNYC
jgi:cell division protein FtsB